MNEVNEDPISEVLGLKIEDPKDLPDEERDTIGAWMGNIMIVRAAIREKHPEGKEYIQDTIPCPICKEGTVSFMISDHYNGHIHAHCSDKSCVNWME